MESGKSSRTKPKANKENFSQCYLLYIYTESTSQNFCQENMDSLLVVFGHAFGQYTVTLGANTNVSLEIQHECGNDFSFESFNLTGVRTWYLVNFFKKCKLCIVN